MLGDVVYMNLDPSVVTVTLNADGGVYPITSFDTDITQEFETNSKMEQDGLWPTYDYDRQMEITIEGAILANDSNDYQTKRQALTSVLRYKPTVRQRRSGILTVTFDGTSEDVKADVSISSISIPRAGAGNAYSEFRLVFLSFLPYWVGVTSGDPYYDV